MLGVDDLLAEVQRVGVHRRILPCRPATLQGALKRWKDIFDYGYERVPNACYAVAVHPQIIGQAHHMMWFERLIEYIASKDGVWFATCAEICDAWVDDDEDRRLMEMEDVRGVELAPVGSGFR